MKTNYGRFSEAAFNATKLQPDDTIVLTFESNHKAISARQAIWAAKKRHGLVFGSIIIMDNSVIIKAADVPYPVENKPKGRKRRPVITEEFNAIVRRIQILSDPTHPMNDKERIVLHEAAKQCRVSLHLLCNIAREYGLHVEEKQYTGYCGIPNRSRYL